ncbi:MAG: hypothetical protein R2754_14210 [Microthrixaceae bacterium]
MNGRRVFIADLRARVGGVDLLINCAGLDARVLGVPKDRAGPFDVDAETCNSILGP